MAEENQCGLWLTVLNTDKSLQFLPCLIFASFVPFLTLLMQVITYLNSSDLSFAFSVQTSKAISRNLQSFLQFLPSNRDNSCTCHKDWKIEQNLLNLRGKEASLLSTRPINLLLETSDPLGFYLISQERHFNLTLTMHSEVIKGYFSRVLKLLWSRTRGHCLSDLASTDPFSANTPALSSLHRSSFCSLLCTHSAQL